APPTRRSSVCSSRPLLRWVSRGWSPQLQNSQVRSDTSLMPAHKPSDDMPPAMKQLEDKRLCPHCGRALHASRYVMSRDADGELVRGWRLMSLVLLFVV